MNFTARARERIPKDAIVVLQGGGNFGDLYPVHQRFREEVVQSFPHNRIVVLGQSVHFSSAEEMDRSAAIFGRHEDLVLCVRDPRSMQLVKGRFTQHVHLVPDMAHQLWTPVARADEDRPTLVCLRTDKEAPYHAHAGGSENSFDWLDFIPRWSCRVFGRILWLHRLEGYSGKNLGARSVWYQYCGLLHAHMESVFRGFGDVVTNRLHGVIFAALLGKRVRYIDNVYGKVGGYAETWLQNSDRLARY
jgi:pyruvyl transferase EpsO